MTRKDCIRKFILGPEVRKYTITTSVLVLILSIATFASSIWNFIPLRVFIFAQIISLMLLVLCKTLHACGFIGASRMFMKSYSCFMICFYILITVCAFSHPDVDFSTVMVEREITKEDKPEDYSIKAASTSGSEGEKEKIFE